MRDVGLDNWEVLPLVLTCGKKTIRGFEREWCKALDTDLNTYSPVAELSKKEYDANYYVINREHIRQKNGKYYESNKESIRQRQAKYFELTIQNKVHHCDRSFKDLQRHLHSIKHGYAYLNPLD